MKFNPKWTICFLPVCSISSTNSDEFLVSAIRMMFKTITIYLFFNLFDRKRWKKKKKITVKYARYRSQSIKGENWTFLLFLVWICMRMKCQRFFSDIKIQNYNPGFWMRMIKSSIWGHEPEAKSWMYSKTA